MNNDGLDWKTEWMASLTWIGEVFLITVVGFAVVCWLVVRYTTWGKQLYRLSYGYFKPGRDLISWRPILTVLLMLLLTIAAVRVDVLVSYANNGLNTALQELNSGSFDRFLGILVILLAISVARAVSIYLADNMFIIQWREWLNDDLVNDWLDGRAYHRSQFLDTRVDNPDQRIQEDIANFTQNTQDLAISGVNSTVSLVSFTIILWNLSGPIGIFGVEIPRGMTFITYLYVLVASVIAFRIGRPLIRLNFLNERLSASFRYALIRLRDNSESVAFYRGEDTERATLSERFNVVIANAWALVFRNAKFQGFNVSVSQVSTIFPIIVQAPRFFAGTIKLGDIIQTASAFGQVHDSLSFFRNSYDQFAQYRATLDRLTGLLDANSAARALPSISVHEQADSLEVRDLTVRRPDGQPLISELSINLLPGESLLVKGPSGSGKTSLLRTLADLWPYASGSISRPTGAHTLFLPQQPYVPLGSLRTALAYPGAPEQLDDDRAREVLRQIQLGHLVERIDEQSDWARTLSPGEQQRLGFARLLLGRPRVAFLDEATSALDEGIEHALYSLIRDRLPDCALVSVGHRSTLDDLHTNQLVLLGDGRWTATTAAADGSIG